VIGLALVTLFIGMWVSDTLNLGTWIDVIVQLSIVGLLFILPILIFQLDPEISNYLMKLKKRFVSQ
jgi:hypothetical protein